tara:strand:+ start:82 stop:906 length:825 start_codon:yes stop_codon:yes gene_type:complete
MVEKEIAKKVKKTTKKKPAKAVKKETKKTTTKKTEKKEEEKITKISKKDLLEKAKKLAAKIETGDEDLKGKLEKAREEEKIRKKTLVTIDEYVKSGIHIGTKVITPHMRSYVYRRRNDGIAIINTNSIDQKLKEVLDLLKEYEPEDFVVICKREAGWKALEKFSELTGVRVFTKKYPAGIMTNIQLPSFFETEMVFICDPWLDKNALKDAKKIKKKIFSLCDTNNYTFDINFVVPCNNKSAKSLGLVWYIITREYLKAKKSKVKVKMEDFVELE